MEQCRAAAGAVRLAPDGQWRAPALALGQPLARQVIGHHDICYWVSPLGRTMQTASILADLWTVPLDRFVADARLVERSYGVWEGQCHSALETEHPEQLQAHAQDPWGFRMSQGESRDELTARVGGWLAEIQPGPLHVAVTHSGCLRALRGLYTAAAPEAILQYREAQTTAVLLKGGIEQLIEVAVAGIVGAGLPDKRRHRLDLIREICRKGAGIGQVSESGDRIETASGRTCRSPPVRPTRTRYKGTSAIGKPYPWWQGLRGFMTSGSVLGVSLADDLAARTVSTRDGKY